MGNETKETLVTKETNVTDAEKERRMIMGNETKETLVTKETNVTDAEKERRMFMGREEKVNEVMSKEEIEAKIKDLEDHLKRDRKEASKLEKDYWEKSDKAVARAKGIQEKRKSRKEGKENKTEDIEIRHESITYNKMHALEVFHDLMDVKIGEVTDFYFNQAMNLLSILKKAYEGDEESYDEGLEQAKKIIELEEMLDMNDNPKCIKVQKLKDSKIGVPLNNNTYKDPDLMVFTSKYRKVIYSMNDKILTSFLYKYLNYLRKKETNSGKIKGKEFIAMYRNGFSLENAKQYAKKNFENLRDKYGVYIFKENDNIIYVGKATKTTSKTESIGKRLSTHRGNIDERKMCKKITNVEFIFTDSVAEASIIESLLIARFSPTYNSHSRDMTVVDYNVINKQELMNEIDSILKNNVKSWDKNWKIFFPNQQYIQ